MHGTVSENAPTQTSTKNEGGSTTSGNAPTNTAIKSSLREMSFEQGEKALSPVVTDPPVQALDGNLTTETTPVVTTGEVENTGEVTTGNASTTLTEPTTDTKGTTASTPPGDDKANTKPDEKVPQKTEKQQVEELHKQTVEALVERITALRDKKQKVFNFRKEKKAAADAKSIFAMLAQYDSQTITAAWQVAKDKAATEFEMLVDAIGYKDAARSYPRESRATLMACEPSRLTQFATDTVKKNPFACQLAVSLLPEAEKTKFEADHPELKTSKKIREGDDEKLDAELLTLKDASLRQTEEGFRERMTKTTEADLAKTKEAEKGQADAAPLIEKVKQLAGQKKFHEALVALGSEANEPVFLSAVRSLDDGTIAAVIRGMTFDQRWNLSGAQVKRVFGARDATQNIAIARDLLDVAHNKTRMVVDKKGKEKQEKRSAITSEEAYEAYHTLKAMPAAHRELFQKTHPGLVTAMELKLNDSMRAADDTDMLGEADKQTVAQLTLKVRGDELWFKAPVDQLEMTLRLAVNANLRGEIKGKLESMKGSTLPALFGDAGRRSAVEGALGKGDVATLPPEMAEDERWLASLKLQHSVSGEDGGTGDMKVFGEKSLYRTVHQANKNTRKENREERKVWKEKKKNGEEVGPEPEKKNPTLVGQVWNAVVAKKGFEAENLALDQLGTNVNAFAGGGDIEFKDFGDRKGENAKEDRNRVDIKFDHNEGVLDFACPHLELVKLRYPMGDMIIETGPAVMKNLKLHVTWPTLTAPEQLHSISVTSSSIEVGNVIVTQPGALIGIKSVSATDLAYSSGEQKFDFGDNPGAAEALALLKEHNPARTLISFGISAAGMSKASKNDQAAKSLEGLTTAFSGKPSGSLGGMTLNVGNMGATGITYNADTFVQKAEVSGMSMVWDNRPSVTGRARMTQLGKMISDGQGRLGAITGSTPDDIKKKERLDADLLKWGEERTALEGQLAKWESLEKLFQEIYEHQKLYGSSGNDSEEAVKAIQARAVAAGFDGAGSMSLAQLAVAVQQKLTSDSGLVASVDQVNVEGVDAMGVKVDKASVKGINVAGSGETFGEAVDPKLMKRLGSTDGETKEGKPLGTSVSVEVGEVDVSGFSMAGSAPTVEALEKTKATYVELTGSVAALEGKDKATLNDAEKTKLAEDKKKLGALDEQWQKVVGEGLTFGKVVDEMLELKAAPGLDKVKGNADLLKRWKTLEDAIASEPLTVESISVSGIAMKGTTQTTQGENGSVTTTASTLGIGEIKATKIEQGDLSVGSVNVGDIKATGAVTSTEKNDGTTSTYGSGNFSVGTLGATDIKAGDNKVDAVSVEGLKGGGSFDQTTKQVADDKNPGKTKTEVLERTGSGSLEVDKITAKGVDAAGTKVDEAGVQGVKLDLKGDTDGTSVGLHVDKVYATGVGQEKGLAAADKKKVSLQAQIDEAKKKGKEFSALDKELKALEDGLASYKQAYVDQDLVLAEVKAIDVRIEAVEKRLKAAERERDTYDHRVDPAAEKKRNEADQKKVDAINKEITTLQAERAEVQKKLTDPQAIIGSFESSLDIKGTASIENFDLKVSGLPTLTELAKEEPDLTSNINVKLNVGPIKIPTVDYKSPGMNVMLASATVETIEADATVKIEKQPALVDGKPTYGVGGLSIKKLSIPSIVGNGLTLTMPVEGETVLIELPTASIKGMALTNVNLAGFDAESLNKATGRFDIKSIEASMSARMGDSLSANGSLSVTDIYADALESGALNFGLTGLTLDKMGFSSKSTEKDTKGNSIVTSIVKMGGKASKLGKLDVNGSYDRVNKTLSTTVGLGDLTLSGINYAGGGTSVGVGFAQLKGASVTVAAKFRSGEVKEGESALEYLDISEIKADYLRGSGISYTGTGTRRERFEDGTIKEHPFTNSIALKNGTLHGLSVRGIRVIGDGLTNISAKLGSGTVQGFNVAMQEDGKNILQANVSATVSGVSVKLVDDDMTASFSSFKGDAAVTSGDGNNAMNFDVKGVDIHGTDKKQATVKMNDMGKESASMSASLPVVHAKEIGFEQGIKGSGYNKPFMLGTATLNDVDFHDDKDKLSVSIGSGRGLMVGGVEVTGTHSGSTPEEKEKGTVNDQFFVPTQKVTWNNLQRSALDGYFALNYPDKSPFTKLTFSQGGVKLDLKRNVDRMWNEWMQGFESNGESTFAYLWKATKSILQTPSNLLWTALFSGIETGFNALSANLLGDWPEIEKLILSSLNSDPKTSIVKGHSPKEGDKTFTSFTSSINSVIQDYVEPAIETACDWGLVYDLIHGDYGRAAATTGAWMVEQAGNLIDWGGSFFGYENTTTIDDDAEKFQEEMRAQRKAEMEAMVKSGLDKVLGWGCEMDLHTKGGDYQAVKEPNPNPKSVKAKEMLRTQLALDVTGGGTLKNMSLGTKIGLSKFKYSDAGNTASIDKLDMKAVAGGGVTAEFEDEGLEMKDANVKGGGAILVTFDNLKYEQDKNFAMSKPEGTQTAQERYKQTGIETDKQPGDNGPLATNDGVYYDAGDYANKVNTGQGVVGDPYSEKLSMGEGIKKAVVANTLDPMTGLPFSKLYESSVVTAKNAALYGKYQTEYDERQKKSMAVQ